MTTATSPATATADRVRCESEVPDPPPDAAGRKQYWEDTVAEAVAELRRRLASTRDEKSFQALRMILDLEKTRLRHKEPVAGTQTTRTGGGRSADGLEPLPVYTESDREFGLKESEPKTEDLTPPAAQATLSVPERVEDGVGNAPAEGPALPTSPRQGEVGGDAAGRGDAFPADTILEPQHAAPLNTPSPERGGGRGVGSASPPKPARPIPLRERVKLQHLQKGVIGHFHDHDDGDLLERRARRRNLDLRDDEPEEIDRRPCGTRCRHNRRCRASATSTCSPRATRQSPATRPEESGFGSPPGRKIGSSSAARAVDTTR